MPCSRRVNGSTIWSKNATVSSSLTADNLSFPARKGTAIIFYHQSGDGQMQAEALHGGCPVLSGTKWAANLWVWSGSRWLTAGVRYGLNGTSTAEGGPVRIEIRNSLSETAHIFYGETALAKIPPGQTHPFSSYVGHRFNARLAGDLSTQVWSQEVQQGTALYIVDKTERLAKPEL